MNRSPGGGANVLQVIITDANIENNDVKVTLSGSGTGALATDAIGLKYATNSVFANNGQNVGPGQYTMAFNRPSILADIYSQILATWYAVTPGNEPTDKQNMSRKWIVLGTIRHSQYNTPYETTCPTATQTAYLYNSACTWQTVTLSSQFVSQVGINGTGVSQNYGTLKYDNGSCNGNRPSGSTTSNSLRQVSSVTGQCNVALVGGTSVATYPGPLDAGSQFSCGDNMQLVTSSNANAYLKFVWDRCPGCNDGHVDNYSSTQACSGRAVGDLPGSPYWTVDDQ